MAGFNVGDRVAYKNQEWQVKAFGNDGFTTINRDEGNSITSARIPHQALLKEATSYAQTNQRATQLTQLESEIQTGLDLCKQGEQQIWIAAHTIRSQVLWGDEFANFEDYCKQRWGWEKSNAHEVAGAGEVIQQLQESGVSDLPTSVAALRPLRKLQPEQRLQVLKSAKSESGRVTADSVKAAISQLLTPPPLINEPAPISKYEYVPIEPKKCWFAVDAKEIEATAIAQNGSGMIRLLWGDQESAVPAAKVMWEQPKASLPDSRESGNDGDELSKEQKTLLYNLKAIAQQRATSVYDDLRSLFRGTVDNTDLITVSEEIETAIIEILEFHFLGGTP